ncbi:hypothetical protein B9Z55_007151 [Caenorhabditis nigoni]|uniref:C2H2-type domain-containing protein n=1 Tax=Caenorhabditis nigoni TaxID=1611254 RepID=A0A2G5V8E4_9PELO|nr:hypothetical protein B9Z55_007151 [Caenorhabditis nigoni]
MDTTASIPSMNFIASSEVISEPVAKKQRTDENEATNDLQNLQNEIVLQQMLQNFFPQCLGLPLMVPDMQTTPNKTASRKNYCDICKKQLCNKYFLRTHMYKMHGIVMDAPLTPRATNKRLIDPAGDFESQEATQKCSECGYRSRSEENLLMHSIRHDKMNSMGAEDAEELLKIVASHVEQATAESIDSDALQTIEEIPNDSETVRHIEILIRASIRSGRLANRPTADRSTAGQADGQIGRRADRIRALARQHSRECLRTQHFAFFDFNQSGSVSPAETPVAPTSDLVPKEAEQLKQTVLVRCTDDQLPAEFVINIPVFSMITEARTIEFELIPLATSEI